VAKTKTTTKRQTKTKTKPKPKTKTKTKKQATPDDEVKVCRRRSDRRTKTETKKETTEEVTKPKAKAAKTTAAKTTAAKTTAAKTAVAETPETETLAPPNQEKRKVQRRRQIDPTTCERDYTDDEIEFMHALDEYKRANGRMFPTCSEILEVVRKLGYERSELNLNQAEVVAAPIVPEADAFNADTLNLVGSVESETI